MKLSKPLIQKIAGHWTRKKVKLVPDAMQLALKEQQGKLEAKQNASISIKSKATREAESKTRQAA